MGEMQMQTYTGLDFDPMNPDPERINIEDIAHALSLQCRYNGHVHRFYSVAQHSVFVSYLLPRHLMLAGLLHDAAETYLGDLIRPVKQEIALYQAIEARLMIAVHRAFGLPYLNSDEQELIRVADNRVLATEARDLIKHPLIPGWDWIKEIEPLKIQINPLSSFDAEFRFLIRFNHLIGV
jgi:hypothetical protein